jgi:N-acetylmuramoyl-L-alanine amidase
MHTNPPSTLPTRRNRGTFFYLQSAIAVAFILATLFTFWTDPGMLPESLKNSFTVVQAPPVVGTPGTEPTPTLSGIPHIGIVAGHKGNDSGSVCTDGLTEASVNEKVAFLVQKSLVDVGYTADVLNEFDPKLDGYRAALLISIHADSCDYINDQATGFKVSAAMSNPHPDRAARLTACMKNRYNVVTGLPLHTSITVDMTSYHAFGEIDPDTTAAIIEVGFLNLDREILTQKTDTIAKGIVDGVICYLKNQDLIINSTPTP